MEAFVEVEAGRLEGWRREIASMRLKALRQSVAITAGVSTLALYLALSHYPGGLVLILAALAFLVLAHMLGQVRMMRFLERDLLSHLLASRADGPTPDRLPTVAAHPGRPT